MKKVAKPDSFVEIGKNFVILLNLELEIPSVLTPNYNTMKKQLLLILVIFICGANYAQVPINDSGNHGLMTITTKKNESMKEIQGSPYLVRDFQYGTATVEGKQPLKVFMRYNVLQEKIEIKIELNAEETYLLPKHQKTVYEIVSDTFVYDQVDFNGKKITGYFLEHYVGQNFRLLEKPTTSVTEAVKAKTGYDRDRPAEIVIKKEYYVVKENNQVENVRLKHRDIKKIFDSDRAKTYLSKNKIRTEQDFVYFISYLDKQ